jgi:hypothetical protein
MTNLGAISGPSADPHAESSRGIRQDPPGFGPPRLRAYLATDPWGGPLILGIITGTLRLVAPGPPWTTVLLLAVGVGALVPMLYRAHVSAGSMRRA